VVVLIVVAAGNAAFNSPDADTDGVSIVVATRSGGAPSVSSTPSPSADGTLPPAPSAAPGPATVPSNGKGIALRPFAEYWGSNAAGMNSDFADMKAANISWARIDLYTTASPNPAFDIAVEAAKDHDISLVVTVHKPSPEKDLGSDYDRAAYRMWLAKMVNRYKHHVKHWEILNEPNLHYEWNIGDAQGSDQAQYADSVHRYVSHLQDGFETVKANDPGATVLFGGLSEWTVERYMDVLLTTEAHRYFDVMSFHPYGDNPDRVASRFQSFKSKMNLNPNYSVKPIWVTEIGFNTSWSNRAGFLGSEQQKADNLAEIMTRLPAAGASLPIFWYTLHENGGASGFGLTRKNQTTLEIEYFAAFYSYKDVVLSGQ